MGWRVTQGVLLDQDGQPYAWKGQVLAHDDPVARLKSNLRLVQQVEDEPEPPEAPPPAPAPIFRPEPEEDDDDLLGLTPLDEDEDPEDEEGIEL